jgi:hypothetical protein
MKSNNLKYNQNLQLFLNNNNLINLSIISSMHSSITLNFNSTNRLINNRLFHNSSILFTNEKPQELTQDLSAVEVSSLAPGEAATQASLETLSKAATPVGLPTTPASTATSTVSTSTVSVGVQTSDSDTSDVSIVGSTSTDSSSTGSTENDKVVAITELLSINGSSERDDNYDPFESADKNDPFFGLLPKILSSIVTNKSIPLEEVLKEHGFYKGVLVLLYNYPVSTLLSLKMTMKDDSVEDLHKAVDTVKEKITNIESRMNNLEFENSLTLQKIKIFEGELDELVTKGKGVLSALSQADGLFITLQLVSPFLVYRGLLSTYMRVVSQPSYISKTLAEQQFLELQRKNLVKRFNRVGIPLIAIGCLLLNEINKNRNDEIIKKIQNVWTGDSSSSSSSSSSFNSGSGSGSNSNSNQSIFPLIKKLKNKCLIYLIPLGMIMIKIFLSNYYPWLAELFTLDFCLKLLLLWTFLLLINYGIELFLYNIYLNNETRVLFPNIFERLINLFYKDLWEQSQSTLKNYYGKFYFRNFLFHLLIFLFILLILLLNAL